MNIDMEINSGRKNGGNIDGFILDVQSHNHDEGERDDLSMFIFTCRVFKTRDEAQCYWNKHKERIQKAFDSVKEVISEESDK